MSITLPDYLAAVDRAKVAAAAYYSGSDPTMTDAEYDVLLAAIAADEAARPDETVTHGLFTDVAAGAFEGGDVPHSTSMLSLDR